MCLATIKPFQPFRYSEQAGDPATLLTQPYDKIDSAMQARYLAANPYNLIRIILGERRASDNDSENVYTRAAHYLDEWIRQGVLQQDSKPGFYAYFQEFTAVAGCQIQYNVASRQFTLLNDAGTSAVGSATAGTAATLQNHQCALNMSGASAASSGNTLTITIPIAFSTPFSGNKNWWLSAQDQFGLTSPWGAAGQWMAEPVPSDFDGNGITDLTWQADASETVGVWYESGAMATTAIFYDYPAPGSYPGWTLVGVADMDRNGVPDLIWQSTATRQVGVWYMGGVHGTTLLSTGYPAPGSYPGWTVVAVHDMNGDGIPDLIWQNDTTRAVVIWYLAGPQATTLLGTASPAPGSYPGWTLVGVGDFNSDGVPDLVWQNDATGSVGVWYMGGSSGLTELFIDWPAPGSYPGMKVVGIADIDKNGVPDLIWQNQSTRAVQTWFMAGPHGTTVLNTAQPAPGNYPGWRVVGPK